MGANANYEVFVYYFTKSSPNGDVFDFKIDAVVLALEDANSREVYIVQKGKDGVTYIGRPAIEGGAINTDKIDERAKKPVAKGNLEFLFQPSIRLGKRFDNLGGFLRKTFPK
jgi:hypothetical protein